MSKELKALKNGKFYNIYLYDNNKPVKKIEHNFRDFLTAASYGNRINNPLLYNYIPKHKQPYKWVEIKE